MSSFRSTSTSESESAQSHASPQSSSPPVSLGLVLIGFDAIADPPLEEIVELVCFARAAAAAAAAVEVVGRAGVLRAEPATTGRP